MSIIISSKISFQGITYTVKKDEETGKIDSIDVSEKGNNPEGTHCSEIRYVIKRGTDFKQCFKNKKKIWEKKQREWLFFEKGVNYYERKVLFRAANDLANLAMSIYANQGKSIDKQRLDQLRQFKRQICIPLHNLIYDK